MLGNEPGQKIPVLCLTRESRLFESLFDVRECVRRRRRALPLGNLTGEADHEIYWACVFATAANALVAFGQPA